MAKFVVMRPNEPPLTGHEAVDSSGTLDKALDAARELAVEVGRRQSVLVHEEGTNNVWSVQWHPDDPVLEGLDADGNALVTWPVEFRITEDCTEESLTIAEDGTVEGREMFGTLTQRDEVIEEEAE